MSESAFQRSGLLDRIGVDHGFGMLRSEEEAPPGVLVARQVHGTRIVFAPPDPRFERADAVATRAPGTAVGVRTADCVPILLVDPRRRAVAAVHAGWRGAASEIACASVETLVRDAGIAPEEIVAAVGPHIGPCCYEVDTPVRDAIPHPEVFTPAERPDHWMLDLWALNALQLQRAGLSAARIERVGGCTACSPKLYWSYRRDGSTGRMLHYVRLPA